MANNRINKYIGAMVLGTVMIAVPSCTDTWDDHYNNEPGSGATLTLWDVIQDNPDYSRFADIVKHAKFYKDDTHEVSTYTYEDILKSSQVNTVWLPDNSVLTEEEYKKWMSLLDESRADGSSLGGYNVQHQFLGNHIALWRHNVSGPGVDTVKMINGKNIEFDKTNLMFANVPLGEDYNIPTVNGVVHVIQGIAPFRENFYESLKFAETQTKFGKYVVNRDTTIFRSSESIEGLPDENGNPTYVDSVYRTSNRLFSTTYYLPSERSEEWQMAERGFGAYINNEDSLFVMLMPTDVAWDAAYEKLKPSHVYATQYEDKSKGDQNAKAADMKIQNLDADSLQKISIEMDIVSPLVFVLRKQPKRNGEIWTREMFKQYKGDGGNPDSPDEYLLNTFNDTLRNIPNGVWDKTSLFDGTEAVEMSNGLAYEVNSWNFPSQYYTPDVEVEFENWSVFYNQLGNNFKVGTQTGRIPLSNKTYQEVTDKYGRVSNNNFFFFDKPSSGQAKVEIKLVGNSDNAYVPNAQVMSGKYDIQVVMVPLWYMELSDGDVDYADEEKADSAARVNMNKFKVQLCYNDNGSSDKKTSAKTITYDAKKVDTLTVIPDHEFKYSYKNMRYSYPTLIIEGGATSTDLKKGYKSGFAIDKIILRRKD